jgi:hypothetical protein
MNDRNVVCASQAGTWRCEGEVWALSHAGLTVRVRARKGLRYLAQLLDRPNDPIHVLDLIQDGTASRPCDARLASELSLRRSPLDMSDPLIDARGRSAYRLRMAELELELAEAERDADLGRCQVLAREKDWLLQALTARSHGSDLTVERARKAVYNRIHEVVRTLDRLHAPLARHLVVSVRTGTYCVYRPDVRVRWSLDATERACPTM